jgi:hypothetical protein
MLDTFGLRQEEIPLFENFYNFLSQKYEIEVVNELEIPFSQLELFRYYKNVEHRQSLKINGVFGCAYLSILEIDFYGTGGGRRFALGGSEFQIWGFVNFNEDFGHTVLRPETLASRLEELIKPVEVKFPEDKLFSRKFHILSNDEMKAHKFLNEKLRTCLTEVAIEDLRFEMFNKTIAISDGKNMGATDLSVFTKFVTDIASVHF